MAALNRGWTIPFHRRNAISLIEKWYPQNIDYMFKLITAKLVEFEQVFQIGISFSVISEWGSLFRLLPGYRYWIQPIEILAKSELRTKSSCYWIHIPIMKPNRALQSNDRPNRVKKIVGPKCSTVIWKYLRFHTKYKSSPHDGGTFFVNLLSLVCVSGTCRGCHLFIYS